MIDTCKICKNDDDGTCRIDWGCCFDPDPEKLVENIYNMLGDD